MRIQEFAKDKDAFLSTIAPDVDWLELEVSFDFARRLTRSKKLEIWFAAMIDHYSGMNTIKLNRAIMVANPVAFVQDLRDGRGYLGSHWSTSRYIEPVMDELPGGYPVTLRGSIDAAQVCWPSTFRQHLTYPLEMEICFEGDVRLHAVVETRTDLEHAFDGSWHPTLEAEEPPASPSMVSPMPRP